MPKIKLTKTVVDGARSEAKDYEIRDTVTPGFLRKVTPSGRRIFTLAYTAANSQRRKPAIGRYGELTVEQARGIAQDWLAEGNAALPPGRHSIVFEWRPDASGPPIGRGGVGTLSINGQQVAERRMERGIPSTCSGMSPSMPGRTPARQSMTATTRYPTPSPARCAACNSISAPAPLGGLRRGTDAALATARPRMFPCGAVTASDIPRDED
jgi:hypothetical protein